MKTHKLRHSGNKPYHCRKCQKSFYSQRSLASHNKCVHDKKFKCAKCDYKAGLKYTLKIHSLIHTGEKPFICEECGARFRQTSHLKRHTQTHGGKRDYECSKRNRSFVTSNSLYKKTHLTVKPFECKLCGKGFIYSHILKNHLLEHAGKQRFQCDQCDFRTNYPSNFRCHKQIHAGEYPFKCDKCVFRTRRVTQLRDHFACHLDASYCFKCDKCNYPAKSQQSIHQHEIKYHSNASCPKPNRVGKRQKTFSVYRKKSQTSSKSIADDAIDLPQESVNECADNCVTQQIRIKKEIISVDLNVSQNLESDNGYADNSGVRGLQDKLETNSVPSINEGQTSSKIYSSKVNLRRCSIILTKLERMNHFSGSYYFRFKRVPNLYEVVRVNL